MGKFEDMSLEGMTPAEQLVFTMRAQTALLEDIREEMRLQKVVQLKMLIEMTHVCDATRGVIHDPSEMTDTMMLQLTDEQANEVITGVHLEQVALDALEKSGQAAIGG